MTKLIVEFALNEDSDQPKHPPCLISDSAMHMILRSMTLAYAMLVLSQCGSVLYNRIFEPRSEKTGLRGFRPGPTQTGLYSYRRWLEASNFGFRKKRDCTIRIAKTKAQISFAVTAKLICVFVFAYAKVRFSHDEAHLSITLYTLKVYRV